MKNTIYEYIWLDSNNNFRSKTKVREAPYHDILNNTLAVWNYDGSSTGQASGFDSEVYIRPVAIYNDPFRNTDNAFLVLCDTWLPNDKPHSDNTREEAKKTFDMDIIKNSEPLFGIEQEFFFMDTDSGKPLGFPSDSEPKPQGPYYCSVGAGKCYGRVIADDILKKAIMCGLKITGLNFEVAPGQCEIQLCDEGLKACDDLWLLRYLMVRTAENYKVGIDFHPKPVSGDWNGSGCHTNFSTKEMREDNGYAKIMDAINRLETKHKDHIVVYGEDNYKRLTGNHETADINTFSYGVADRGASIRIPRFTYRDKKGYLEDRRPASNMDPYLVCKKIVETTIL